MKSILSLVVASALFGTVACGGTESSSPANEGAAEAITGVTDLSEMEAALALSKDEKNTEGNYERPEAKLTAGPCYTKWMTGANAGRYELRRYTTGAAFFKKTGSGLAAGDQRPVLCVDVDVALDNGGTYTTAVSDIEIDAVLRYRLGAPTGSDGAAGTSYDEFKNGAVTTASNYCPKDGFDPLAKDALSSLCFGHVDFPGNSDMLGALQLLVYQYAYKTNTSANRYSFSSDPVGRFVRMEGTADDQHVEFEKLDGHASRSADGKSRTIAITPKGSDASVADRAIVSCTLTDTENESYAVVCKGI